MSEALCADCPLRSINHEYVEIPRIDPMNEEDVMCIELQENADAIMGAIAKSRPGRCDALRNILPSVRSGVNTRPFAKCPDVGLHLFLSEYDEQLEDL